MKYTSFSVSLEGGEGSGKSTVIRAVADHLASLGADVLTTREPGGVRIAEAIRAIILDRAFTEMDPRTEALLFAAARRQHLVEKVLPALEQGRAVVIDRFVDSSLVYQGYARGIGIEEVRAVNDFAILGFRPELTLLLDVEPETGLQRIAGNPGREVNKLDLELAAFHRRVREGYLQLAAMYPERIVVVDANRAIDEVTAACRAEIDRALGRRGTAHG